MTDFPTSAFQASLSVEAILFGVFGFFYSAYAVYYSLAKPIPAEVVKSITLVCRVIVDLISFNALLNIYSLYCIYLSGNGNIILEGGFAISVLVIATIAGIWAFRVMK